MTKAQAEPCPEAFLALADRMTAASGEIVARYFRTAIAVDDKPDESPVTIADRSVETVIRDLIGKNCPGHGIVGEEYGTENPDAEFVWVIDPIDGTKSFISGVPLFGTLIALLKGGVPIMGVVDHPALGERWVGARGHGTTHNGKPARVRDCAAIDRATLCSTSPDMYRGTDAEAFRRLHDSVKLVRYGTDCYATGLLASGYIDLHTEAGLKPFDYCAMVPVIENAGGRITDWDGRPLRLDSDGRMLAAGDPRAHDAALALLSA
jgi:inositol-phosphate phosphatase/L-galactose 1-phosphate phosphatase/histidinol-phosphatase